MTPKPVPPNESSHPPGGWKKPLAICLTLLVIGVGGLLAYDVKLEPYADLLPRPEISRDTSSNGFYFLHDKWSSFRKLEASDHARLDRIASGQEPADRDYLETIRTGRENLAADLHSALESPNWGVEKYIPGNGYTNFGQLMPPLRYLALEARVAAQTGEFDKALAITADLTRLANRQISSSGSLIDLLVGISVQDLAAALSCDQLAILPNNEPLLSLLEEVWRTDPLTPEAIHQTIAGEAVFSRETLMGGRVFETANGTRWRPMMRVFVKKNLTLNRYHALARILEKTINDTASAENAGPGARLASLAKVNSRFSANFLGEYMLEQWAQGIRLFPESAVPKERFLSRAMRVRLALEKWKHARGSNLPEKLEQLVPEFLSEVPIDPWNGKPSMWDHTTKVIYAIGKDWLNLPPPFKQGFVNGDAENPGIRLEKPAVP